ncbi:hypothetical protein BE21_04615 [Sorangium cellulosum]|uniref:Gp5/Type VI secretion system Vgr protein OB-fold domain-containing protein n=1 Tax=Sorangium cellulosum TaxID=56 RepID=A0A150TFR9_SORCE|nr:hypothetical protein BE21_04615 [Sorangium cellulosum]
MTPSEIQIGLIEAIVAEKDGEFQTVKVKFPRLIDRLTNQPVVSDWAPVLSPYGASDPVKPELDDHVVVFFYNGDFRQPVVLGKIYSKSKPPPG